MNRNIEKLFQISNQKKKTVIGLMSGTSLDGLDVALCEISGQGKQTVLTLKAFTCIPYSSEFVADVQTVFAQKMVSLEKICFLHKYIAHCHAEMVLSCLKAWNLLPGEVDFIASHGQTIYHAPLAHHQNPLYGDCTFQIGDGDHLAVETGILTVSDFRQKQIAAGGSGAPLAPYGDYLIYAKEGTDVLLLNIGGIANVTYLPAHGGFDRTISGDTGPGNTLMDAWVRLHFPGHRYDENGQWAQQGSVYAPLLEACLQDPYFALPFPKSTGVEYFGLPWLKKIMDQVGCGFMTAVDVLATLNALSVHSIAACIQKLPLAEKGMLQVSGGGVHNMLLMESLQKKLPNLMVSELKDADAKEAMLFAVLANECLAGDIAVFANGAKGFPAASMGKISFPY